MDSYAWSQIIALGLAIAVLVILIVVLVRNNIAKDDHTEAEKITMLDNKVNWLFALTIASVGLMVAMGMITLFYMIFVTRK